jgi:hypothetical protein
VIASTLSVLLWLGPPALPPEPPTSAPPAPTEQAPVDPPAPTEQAPADPVPPELTPIVVEPRALPPDIAPVEFPLAPTSTGTPAPTTSEPLPRMEATPSSTRRSIVELRDPFARPVMVPRTGSLELAQQRLLMPDLKDPFAEGTRPIRSRTLDSQVPSELRDPFRDGLGRPRVGPCQRTTTDGTPVQAPGAAPPECPSGTQPELLDPFRESKPPAPPPGFVAPTGR